MEVFLKADVACSDDEIGEMAGVIIARETNTLSHIVVKSKFGDKQERLVPLSLVSDAGRGSVMLSCSSEEFQGMSNLETTDYVDATGKGYGTQERQDRYALQRFSPSVYAGKQNVVAFTEESIPDKSVIIHHNAKVFATDDTVGTADAFEVDPETGAISQVVLIEGHLFGKYMFGIPVEHVDTMLKDEIYLKVDKAFVGGLPSTKA